MSTCMLAVRAVEGAQLLHGGALPGPPPERHLVQPGLEPLPRPPPLTPVSGALHHGPLLLRVLTQRWPLARQGLLAYRSNDTPLA